MTPIEPSFSSGNVPQQLSYMKIYSQFWEERAQILELKA